MGGTEKQAIHHLTKGNSKFDADYVASKASERAVCEVVQCLLKNKDEDQVDLTLLHFLKHPVVKPFLGQIRSMYSLEPVIVRLHAAKGTQAIVRRVYEGKVKGGRSKECRALLSIIGICLADGLDDHNGNVSKDMIYRTVFKSLPRKTARRLLEKSGEKQKKFRQEEMHEFTCVEEEARRSKFTDKDYIELRKYMCNNRYTRDFSNKKDTVRARTIHGKFSS